MNRYSFFTFFPKSNENMITIGNLSQNTNYSISVAVVYSSEEYSIIAKGRQFKTLGRGYKPKEIQDISLLKFDEDESDEKLVTALISWKPSSGEYRRFELFQSIYRRPFNQPTDMTGRRHDRADRPTVRPDQRKSVGCIKNE